MELLFSNYNGTLSQALQLGISLGVMVGIIMFAFVVAEGGRFRVLFGVLIGALLMGTFQAVQVGQLVVNAYNQDLLKIGSLQMDEATRAALSGLYRTVDAAILGGLIMIVVFSTRDALRGAVFGFLLGAVAAVAGWALFALINIYPPNYLFALFLLVVGYFIYDTIGTRLNA